MNANAALISQPPKTQLNNILLPFLYEPLLFPRYDRRTFSPEHSVRMHVHRGSLADLRNPKSRTPEEVSKVRSYLRALRALSLSRFSLPYLNARQSADTDMDTVTDDDDAPDIAHPRVRFCHRPFPSNLRPMEHKAPQVGDVQEPKWPRRSRCPMWRSAMDSFS